MEPAIFLLNRGVSTTTFFRQTTILHIKAWLLMLVPLIVYQLFFFHTIYDIVYLLFALIASIICVVFFIVNKYIRFEPDTRAITNQFWNTIACTSLIIPFFILLPMIQIFRQYNKANSELKRFF